MRICPLGAKLLHVDESTYIWADVTKLIVTFCSYFNTPTNEKAFSG